MARTLFAKIWEPHVVRDLGDGWALLHVDRQLLHDLSGPPALGELHRRKLAVRNPELTFAVPDHAISSAPGRNAEPGQLGGRLRGALQSRAAAAGIRFFDLGQRGQGIVHVMGPELGLVLPGLTLICGDSHTCTNGALGALAFGVGNSESAHALATQTLRQRRPKEMRVRSEGALAPGVSAKDLVLHAIAALGAAAGSGHAIEWAGSAIRALSIEGRLTICNLSVEIGAKAGLVAPDETTFDYLRGRLFAPQGDDFERAVVHWRELASDSDARFHRDEAIDATRVAPMVTWGTSPEDCSPIDSSVPDPESFSDPEWRRHVARALEYMQLSPRTPLSEVRVDRIFIGSCTNSRIEDLRAAARVLKGQKASVPGMVSAGSSEIKRQAEREGLHRIFLDAGLEWRDSGCSMCNGSNGEIIGPGLRCASTTNRNFEGRQGRAAMTHIMSPAMVAAAAVTGRLTDVRRMA